MSREVARIRQVNGATRIVLAQDAAHAARARDLLRRDASLIDRLDGVDGIKITTRDLRG